MRFEPEMRFPLVLAVALLLSGPAFASDITRSTVIGPWFGGVGGAALP